VEGETPRGVKTGGGRRWRKVLLAAGSAFALFSLLGFFVAPPLLKSYLLQRLSQYLERKVTIASITVNPYRLTASIKGVHIARKGNEGTLASFDEIYLDLKGLSSDRRNLVFEELRVNRPYIFVERRTDGTYNLSDVIAKRSAGGLESQIFPFYYVINRLKVLEGTADFVDGPNGTTHRVTDVNMNLPFVSTAPRDSTTDINPSLSMKVNGTPYRIEGTTKPFADTLETNLDVELADLDIPYYLSYLPLRGGFTVEKGFLDAKLRITFARYKDQLPALALAGDLTVRDLVLADGERQQVLGLRRLEVSLRSAEPFASIFRVARVGLSSPTINLLRDEAGDLNLAALAGGPEKDAAASSAGKQAGKGTGHGAPGAALDLVVDAVEMEGGTVTFVDNKPLEPVRTLVQRADLTAENITLGPDGKGTFSFSCLVNGRGEVRVRGEAGFGPPSVKATVDIRDVEAVPFQGYFSRYVNMGVTGGAVSASGSADFVLGRDGGPTGGFTGTLSLNRFSSIDEVNGDDLLTWDSLFLRRVDVSLDPPALVIDGIAWSNFYARIIVHPDRSLNVQHLVEGGDGTEEGAGAAPPQRGGAGATAREKEKLFVKIDGLTMQGGVVEFEDRSVTPKVALRMDQLAGRLSGLSSDAGAADLDVRGRVGQSAPIEITGKINPFLPALYADFTGRARGVELTPASPYSGRYLGYTLEKGRVSLDIKYTINNRKLDSQNRIFLDQLTLGEKVESAEATKLPVKLAITLLKDRNGRIELDIPVEGSLDDPQFSVWRIVWKIVGNLLVKAATSPFALLGSLFGGGEELGYVEFEYGSSVVSPVNSEKLKKLSGALKERPGLTMDVEGHVDPQKDRMGLRDHIFNRKVAAQKLKDMAKAGGAPPKVEDVTVEPGEYEKYLRLAYKAEKFPKPRNVLGLEKTLPVADMEKLMATSIEVKDEDLRLLAADRASAVRDAMTKEGVESDRLFVVEGKSLAPEKKEKVRESRVDFRLK
jgi:hypothetical protein